MTSITGKVAAVTGAGSGIGRALALGLARRGAKLALSDVNEAGLAETVAAAEALGATVHSAKLDVSDRAAFEAYATTVAEHFGVVHQIYNNAGIAFNRPIVESTYEDYERVWGINLWGVLTGTKAFLPHLIASGDGYVINISSLNGIMAQANMSHYVSAKFAVRGLTETLRLEMADAGHPVKALSVHPGGIKTNIASNATIAARERGEEITAKEIAIEKTYNEKLLKMSPDAAAEVILKAVEKDKSRVVVGNDAKALDLLIRVAPSTSLSIISSAMKRIVR
ncbi:MAG: SDR family NAD(P)-dependent oxidoreductase [Solirubrobacteraceae bacterium]|nr:SDR family NAD(P)-dependent oxidoreductase [Solirubrobacteraceae bacterium]